MARVREAPTERDWLDDLRERRAIKLIALGAGTPTRVRRWARDCGLTEDELRERGRAASRTPGR